MSHNYIQQEVDLQELLFRNTNDQEFLFELRRVLGGIDAFETCDTGEKVFEKYGLLIMDCLGDLDGYVPPKQRKNTWGVCTRRTEFVESFWPEAFDADRLIDEYEDITEEVINRLAKKDLLERRELALSLCPELQDEFLSNLGEINKLVKE